MLDEVGDVLVFQEVLGRALVEESEEGIEETVKVQLVVEGGGDHLSNLQQAALQLVVSHSSPILGVNGAMLSLLTLTL